MEKSGITPRGHMSARRVSKHDGFYGDPAQAYGPQRAAKSCKVLQDLGKWSIYSKNAALFRVLYVHLLPSCILFYVSLFVVLGI